jgi:UDP-2,4-diacetamido-2,4,6-trideoxy-beta-L-altropyranose hydrolase
LVLNQNLGSQAEDYKKKVSDNCKLLLGCNYALLRPEFSKMRERALKKRKSTKEIKNILISFGGSDIDNITYEILQQINDSFNVVVILGGASTHNIMIKDYVKDKNIAVIISADNMVELMLNTDLAIGAGGSTSWERCCLGLPTLLYVLAENQKEIAKNLEKLGAAILVKDLKNDLQMIVSDINLWQDMSSKAQNICNGTGVKRVIQEL